MTLDYFTLLSCNPDAPYALNRSISVYPPTLGDIRRTGYPVYQSYINILSINKSAIAQTLKLQESQLEGDTMMLIALLPYFRDVFAEAVSFFIRDELSYDEHTGFGLKDGTFVSLDELRELRRVILQFSYVAYEKEDEPVKFRSENTRKRYERMLALKAERAKASRGKPLDPNMELSNLIGAVSAFSSTYNLLNIWGLTVFQFYDQYIRLHNKLRLDVLSLRWAAYSKEDFDWDAWHKTVKSSQ